MFALILALMLPGNPPDTFFATPTFSGGTHFDVTDGADVWAWYAEHCGELFAMGEADTSDEARAALATAIARHEARTGGMCDAPSHPYAEDAEAGR